MRHEQIIAAIDSIRLLYPRGVAHRLIASARESRRLGNQGPSMSQHSSAAPTISGTTRAGFFFLGSWNVSAEGKSAQSGETRVPSDAMFLGQEGLLLRGAIEKGLRCRLGDVMCAAVPLLEQISISNVISALSGMGGLDAEAREQVRVVFLLGGRVLAGPGDSTEVEKVWAEAPHMDECRTALLEIFPRATLVPTLALSAMVEGEQPDLQRAKREFWKDLQNAMSLLEAGSK